ncbi:hypothetical protein BSNK01_13650 [Bacillaceae bacterium]
MMEKMYQNEIKRLHYLLSKPKHQLTEKETEELNELLSKQRAEEEETED